MAAIIESIFTPSWILFFGPGDMDAFLAKQAVAGLLSVIYHQVSRLSMRLSLNAGLSSSGVCTICMSQASSTKKAGAYSESMKTNEYVSVQTEKQRVGMATTNQFCPRRLCHSLSSSKACHQVSVFLIDEEPNEQTLDNHESEACTDEVANCLTVQPQKIFLLPARRACCSPKEEMNRLEQALLVVGEDVLYHEESAEMETEIHFQCPTIDVMIPDAEEEWGMACIAPYESLHERLLVDNYSIRKEIENRHFKVKLKLLFADAEPQNLAIKPMHHICVTVVQELQKSTLGKYMCRLQDDIMSQWIKEIVTVVENLTLMDERMVLHIKLTDTFLNTLLSSILHSYNLINVSSLKRTLPSPSLLYSLRLLFFFVTIQCAFFMLYLCVLLLLLAGDIETNPGPTSK